MSNEIIKITYTDAHYSYTEPNSLPDGVVESYGRLMKEEDEFVEYELAWTENPHKTIFGIVLPKGALVENSFKSDWKSNYKIGNEVELKWKDIFAFNEDYNGLRTPTDMITQGVVSGEDRTFLVVSNPKTINLKTNLPHPIKAPKVYAIPKSLIFSIEITKNE